MTATSLNELQLDLLSSACAKRVSTSVELEDRDGNTQTAKMHLLSCDDQALYIDRPTQQGMPIELTSGTSAKVSFVLRGERYTFRTEVVDEARVSIADGHHVPGFALSIPAQIERTERRHDCRVSLAHCGDLGAQFSSDGSDTTFSARLVNISAGGLAAISFEAQHQDIVRGQVYRVQFQLPKIKREFFFSATLCHVRQMSDGCIMGIQVPTRRQRSRNAACCSSSITICGQAVQEQNSAPVESNAMGFAVELNQEQTDSVLQLATSQTRQVTVQPKHWPSEQTIVALACSLDEHNVWLTSEDDTLADKDMLANTYCIVDLQLDDGQYFFESHVISVRRSDGGMTLALARPATILVKQRRRTPRQAMAKNTVVQASRDENGTLFSFDGVLYNLSNDGLAFKCEQGNGEVAIGQQWEVCFEIPEQAQWYKLACTIRRIIPSSDEDHVILGMQFDASQGNEEQLSTLREFLKSRQLTSVEMGDHS